MLKKNLAYPLKVYKVYSKVKDKNKIAAIFLSTQWLITILNCDIIFQIGTTFEL
jgi:hypothetical protein